MPRTYAIASLILLLAGIACTAVNPSVAQLEDLKELQSSQEPQAFREIVAQRSKVAERCATANEACPQMQLIVGHACYTLATKGWGEDPVAEYDCAIDELGTGLANLATGAGSIDRETRREYAVALMASLRERIQRTSRLDQAQPLTAQLATVAADHRRAYPQDWAGWFYGALADVQTGNAALNRGRTREGCQGFAQAQAKLERGEPLYGQAAAGDPFTKWIEQVERTLSTECSGA
jgi:hypothetical protein